MNPHHIHLGPAFRAAIVGSALLLAAKSAGLAEGPGAFDPDQAIVFDGSTGQEVSVEFPAPRVDSCSV